MALVGLFVLLGIGILGYGLYTATTGLSSARVGDGVFGVAIMICGIGSFAVARIVQAGLQHSEIVDALRARSSTVAVPTRPGLDADQVEREREVARLMREEGSR